jgi:hypothetical protein
MPTRESVGLSVTVCVDSYLPLALSMVGAAMFGFARTYEGTRRRTDKTPSAILDRLKRLSAI